MAAKERLVVTDEGSRGIVRGHCPNCDADRNAEVLAEDTVEEEDKLHGFWAKSSYSILRCLGCDRRYIRHGEVCSEDAELHFDPATGEAYQEIEERVTYWPTSASSSQKARRVRPAWLGLGLVHQIFEQGFAFDYPALATLLTEVYTALDNDLQTLATIGIRTVFDCASQLLGCDADQNFAEKLKVLTARNKISGEEKEILSTLTDAGSAAAHRGWKPTESDINSLMDALEHFLHRAFVLTHELRRVKENIPPRATGH
jgi:hypothetical protein